MEGVDHVDVIQIGSRSLVGQVDRVVEGQIPDREGLELGISRLDAPLIVVIQLGQARCHLAAAGAGGRDDDQGPAGLDVVVVAEALVADDQGNVGGVARDRVVAVDAQAERFELLLIGDGGRLARKAGQNDAAHIQTVRCEGIHEAQQIHVVGDAQVAADLVLLNIGRVDDDHDLHLVAQGLQHCDLGVGSKARQHPGSVVIVEQLASEFKVEFASELCDPFFDVTGLCLQIFVIIKTDLHDILPFLKSDSILDKNSKIKNRVHYNSENRFQARALII